MIISLPLNNNNIVTAQLWAVFSTYDSTIMALVSSVTARQMMDV